MAASFTSTTNNTNIITIPYVSSATQPHTMMAWVYLNGTTPVNYRDVVTIDPNIYMQTFSDGIRMDFGTASHDWPVVVFNPNTWYHVTGVYIPTSTTARQIYGYINGAQYLNTFDNDTFFTSTQICIGNSTFSSNVFPLNGSVRDVRIWNRALDPTSIVTETNSAVPVNREGLVIWAPFDDNLISNKGSVGGVWTPGSAVTLQAGPLQPYIKNRKIF